MKKLIALTLALLMALSCAVASAETVYTQLTIDRDVAKDLMTALEVPEEQIGTIDPILAVLSALGVKVAVAGEAMQLDVDLNGQGILTMGGAATETGIVVASTLFPNYVLTASWETISAMMEQVAANMPGMNAGGVDANAMAEVFGGYFERYIQACSAAATVGEPVTGEYEYEGVVFDTFIPVTIDMAAIKAAMDELVEEMLNDEAVVSVLQTSMASSGAEFDPEEIRKAYNEMMTEEHMPNAATAEFYAKSDDDAVFYMSSDAFYEGRTDASYRFDMLSKGEGAGSMHFWMNDIGMTCGAEYAPSGVHAEFSMEGMYFGFDLRIDEGETSVYDVDVYVLNAEKPLFCVKVTVSEDAEMTLSTDAEGKTALAVEDVMNDESGEATNGLLGDVMANGLGTLVGVAMEAVPELGALMGMLSGAAA